MTAGDGERGLPGQRDWWSPLPAWLHREMALTGGALYITGGLIVLLPFVFPDIDLRVPAGIVAIGVIAIGVGILFLLSANRWILSQALYVTATGLGAVLISLGVAFGGQEVAVTIGVLYAFVSAYGFYYYPDKAAATDVAIGAVGYAVALAMVYDNRTEAVYIWIAITATAVLSGALTARLGGRSRALLVQERELTAALEDADHAKTALLRTVSHDLRVPLSSVIGSLMTVLHDEARVGSEMRKELLTRSLANAERIHRILNDLLDMERIAAGDLTLRPTSMRLDEVVAGVLEAIEFNAHHCRTYLTAVTADLERTRMERVVENLVGNAVKHTPPGTVIAVTVDRAEDGRPRLVVEDNGPGIPADLRRGMFQAFGNNSKSTPGSTGLGLSLAARFTELHGGHLTYVDAPGGGARFEVLLPVSAAGADPDLAV